MFLSVLKVNADLLRQSDHRIVEHARIVKSDDVRLAGLVVNRRDFGLACGDGESCGVDRFRGLPLSLGRVSFAFSAERDRRRWLCRREV